MMLFRALAYWNDPVFRYVSRIRVKHPSEDILLAECMTPELWKRVEIVFEVASGMPVQERRAFLEKECKGDAELIAEIEALLAQDVTQSDTIEFMVGRVAGQIADTVTAIDGEQIGNYRILRLIGEGGMGTVYEAAHVSDLAGPHFALKLVRPGTMTDSVRRRFLNERIILGSLKNTSIVSLVDEGDWQRHEGEPAVPYMVMELIQGENIRVYCDRAKLGVHARLEQFLKVLAAVKYAHQNMIVHRDLKPANILVTQDGAPHLVDFGIARVVEERRLPGRIRGQRGAVPVMTPAYASPEQLQGEPVSTLDDVYSLGLVLFELLTGIRARSTKSGSTAEIYRAACDTPIPLPSEAAADRKWLRGALDQIVSTSIRKDAAERYQSVDALAVAIRRFLTLKTTLKAPYPQALNHCAARTALSKSVSDILCLKAEV